MAAGKDRKIWLWIASGVAILFGLLTIKSGGDVLFWSETARLAAGDYVPFVVWFNFLAGFAYILAGFALWRRRHWAPVLSFAIALATVTVLLAFFLHVLSGGAYEPRTAVALILRSAIWSAIAIAAYKLPGIARRRASS